MIKVRNTRAALTAGQLKMTLISPLCFSSFLTGDGLIL